MVDISLQDAEHELNHSTTYTSSGYSIKEIVDLIHVQRIIGVFFKNTPNSSQKASSATVSKLIQLFKKESTYPLLFGIDAECGLGMRLEDKKIYPKNRILSKSQDNNHIYHQHKEIGQEAKKIGINFITSPIADIAPLNSYMKDRSYGVDPHIVCSCCFEAAQALTEEGIITCAKHFPGHGRTITDSHINLPTIAQSYDELENYEFIPFKYLIEHHIPTIMVGHLLVPSIDKTYPATLSNNIINVLRNNLHFTGLIISDALDMGAIQHLYNPIEINYRALEAGIDILLFPREINATYDYLATQITANDTFKKIIEEKIQRINHFLKKYLHNE